MIKVEIIAEKVAHLINNYYFSIYSKRNLKLIRASIPQQYFFFFFFKRSTKQYSIDERTKFIYFSMFSFLKCRNIKQKLNNTKQNYLMSYVVRLNFKRVFSTFKILIFYVFLFNNYIIDTK